LGIGPPDLPQPRGSEAHSLRRTHLESSDDLELRLSQLAALYRFCLDLPKIIFAQLGTPIGARSVHGRACADATKFKFNYLNGNLMVPQIHPFSLSFDFNSDKRKAKAGHRFSSCEQK
jgi:hypothetical protein